MSELEGKVAIVTGASRGLGKDIAVALGKAGAKVMAVARTDDGGKSRIPGTLMDTVAAIEAAGGAGASMRCDVTSEADIKAVIDATRARWGGVDILVNNAGVLIPGSVMDLQPKHWELIFRVNVTGPFLFCRAVVPELEARGGGHIINISSRGAIGPGAGPYAGEARVGGAAYGATKAALERFTQGLAVEVYQKRISANALSPHLPIWSEGGHFFRSQAGEPDYAGWRMTGEVIGDAAVVICRQQPGTYTGNILYDELVMRNEGGLGDDEIARRYPIEH